MWNILFPKFCQNCQREGDYFCADCLSLIEVLENQYCPFCFPPKIVPDGKTCFSCRTSRKLAGLFGAASYENFLVKKIINRFKYEPYFIKGLAEPLSSLIITHLANSNKLAIIQDSFLVPVPLHIRKEKRRGFNQAEELAKKLSEKLEIPLLNNVLIKTKNVPSQTELKKEEREKNIKGVFSCLRPEIIANKKILLVDDVFTSGATMEECAFVLKSAGTAEVWGVVVARG